MKNILLGGAAAAALSLSALGAANAEGFSHGWRHSGDRGLHAGPAGWGGAARWSWNGESTSSDIDAHFGDINPFYGDINPFYGDINPFYGDISPFWGDISPFWGDISPFYGDINPFYGDINPFWGDISPFWGDISPFSSGDPAIEAMWGDIGPFWGDIGPFWGDLNAMWGDLAPFSSSNEGAYETLAAQLADMFGQAEAVFGAAVTADTGLSFQAGFVDPFLADYNVDLDDLSTLDDLDAAHRSMLFMDFYDGLMAFSGADRVDHWMATVNWRPVLTQDLNQGERAVIGILDTGYDTHGNGRQDVYYYGGYGDDVTGHGEAVASLLVDPHDGTGLMGMAPHADVAVYNPFDDTGSASWADVRKGIEELADQDAHIINMSLGFPGYVLHQDWEDVLTHELVANQAGDILFVKAAGNEGAVQPHDISWGGADWIIDRLLIVGSVAPDGTISSFSNTPGDARICFNDTCSDNTALMDRFLVAPGELILVSAGDGELTRHSGTSFAAPLVTGTAALIQGRWPWWQSRPRATADLILATATDLGAPGVDEVYGHGLLNVEAALSPISFDALTIYHYWGDGDASNLGSSVHHYQMTPSELRTMVLNPGVMSINESYNDYIVAFEDFGRTFRDFNIPLSELLYGQNLNYQGYSERAQSYLYERMLDWATGGPATGFAFGDRVEFGEATLGRGRVTLGFTASQRDPFADYDDNELAFHTGFVVRDQVRGLDLRFGTGEASLAFSASNGSRFGFFSDHRPETGGVNPVLGFASGDAYVMGGADLGQRTRLTLGLATTSEHASLPNAANAQRLPDYGAAAVVFGVAHEITPFLRANASYTVLEEDTGLLGGQGTGALSLSGGALTQSVTFGGELDLSPRTVLSASATVAETAETRFEDSALSVAEGGLVSTAFQISAARLGVFSEHDAARLSVIQPLHVETGALEYSAVEVVDRATGELGVVTQTWELGGERPLALEALYATPLFEGRANLNAFLRADVSGSNPVTGQAGATLGLRFATRF